ncbi:MAG: ECF transporter S component [Clostridia bacterium]|nr:ECF transporter S component [Clostridia bacterium]
MRKETSTKNMVLGAVMTALVIVFQLVGTYTTFFGPFSTALALIPIVIGSALCGVGIGTWLGFVFGFVVLISGGANLFFPFHFWGTIITVLVKGMACGLAAGVAYNLLKKFNSILAVVAAAIVCPIVNTSVFLLGCAIFFLSSANGIAEVLKLQVSGFDVFWALATANFIFEIGMNLVLSPIIVRLIGLRQIKN